MEPTKSLTDFSEYAAALARVEKPQAKHGKDRDREIEINNQITQQGLRGPAAAALRAELDEIQKREPTLLEEVETARQELDRVRGRLSPELCKPARARSMERVKKRVAAIRAIIEANEEDLAERHALERNDISTASLGSGIFAIGGAVWTNEFPLSGYLRQVTESFPELPLTDLRGEHERPTL
jgi:hypothetical protein